MRPLVPRSVCRTSFYTAILAALAPTPSQAQLPGDLAQREATFDSLDKNSDGFLDSSEAPERMKPNLSRFDANADGKVSKDEMRSATSRKATGKRRAMPKRAGEVVAPADHDERSPDALRPGDLAPDFSLPLVSQPGKVKLSDLYREKPVVLVFGSISCPPFRAQVQQVESLFNKHADKANFLMVYIREAHPDSKIMVKRDDDTETLQSFVQTDDAELRVQHAKTCARTLDLSFPTAMDLVDNKVSREYAGWPIRLVTIGTDGKIIDPGAPGPQGFSPEKLGKWLSEL